MAWQDLYPFQSNFQALGGHRLHYVVESPGTPEGDGQPVLMVHGNPTWSFYYRNLVKSLGTRYRAIAIDHLGCGLSDKPAGHDYCLQNHIDNLCQLVDQLDLSNITLVAHDWGGAIGLGTLLARRDRFARIVLFNTAAFPPPYIPFRIRVCRWPVFGPIALKGFNAFSRAAISMATEQPGGLPRDVAAGLLAPYDSWQHREAVFRFVKDIPLSKNHRTWSVLEHIESELPSLQELPSMLIWGMRDWCFRPECLTRFEQYWPQAEIHRIADAGHYVVEDAFEEIKPLMHDFLERHR